MVMKKIWAWIKEELIDIIIMGSGAIDIEVEELRAQVFEPVGHKGEDSLAGQPKLWS